MGNKTECALLEYMTTKLDVNYEEIRKKHKHNIAKLYVYSLHVVLLSSPNPNAILVIRFLLNAK